MFRTRGGGDWSGFLSVHLHDLNDLILTECLHFERIIAFYLTSGETEVAPIILNGSDKELPGEEFFE